MAKKPRKNFALRFISGKYQGGELLLPRDREIVMGRSSELDMVLVEDMVSRRHAKLSLEGDDIYIQDLGSTNGTFVNGEKVKKSKLNEGDRILVGTSIIKLVDLGDAPEVNTANAPGHREMTDAKATAPVRTMSGVIEEIPLPDLLQLFSTSKKSGVLSIHRGHDVGRIFLDKGRVIHASLNERSDIQPLKVFYRLLTWQNGTFELEPPQEREFIERIEMSTEGLLMEGMRHLDEQARLAGNVPSSQSNISLVRPMHAPLTALAPEELNVLQLVINFQTTESILNNSPLTDLETYEALAKLISAGYVESDG
ncbi:MAG: DUF4388 domain-containing protein [Myxococcales bacterium]|nr:DUF4388 domain-containing protein [Myxococcales bacterium]